MLSVLGFVYDLVHGICAADLIDWCHRDVTAIGVGSELPDFPFSAVAVVKVKHDNIAFPSVTPTAMSQSSVMALIAEIMADPG